MTLTQKQYYDAVLTSVAAHLEITEKAAEAFLQVVEPQLNTRDIMHGHETSTACGTIGRIIAARINETAASNLAMMQKLHPADGKVSIPEAFRMLHSGEIDAVTFKTLHKDAIAEFLLEVFNKGLLNNYLGI